MSEEVICEQVHEPVEPSIPESPVIDVPAAEEHSDPVMASPLSETAEEWQPDSPPADSHAEEPHRRQQREPRAEKGNRQRSERGKGGKGRGGKGDRQQYREREREALKIRDPEKEAEIDARINRIKAKNAAQEEKKRLVAEEIVAAKKAAADNADMMDEEEDEWKPGAIAGKARSFDRGSRDRPRVRSAAEVFVGGLAFSVDNSQLEEIFSECGTVLKANVIMDREDPDRSRGFGFVSFADAEAVETAIQTLDGEVIDGRKIHVNRAGEEGSSTRPGGGKGRKGGGSSRDARPMRSDEPETEDEKRWRKEREKIDRARIERHKKVSGEGGKEWSREWDNAKAEVPEAEIRGRGTRQYTPVYQEEEV